MTDIKHAYSEMISNLPPFAVPVVRAAVILVLAFCAIKFSEGFIDRLFLMKRSDKLPMSENKRKTLTGLLKSIVRYVTYFVVLINLLELLGIRTESLLTAAGIGGLAVGFGAQNLVKDVISGFFIIFEDQYGVGDYVEVAGVAGTVEDIGIRSTRLRDFGGQLHIIPNGEITRVTNHSRGAMRALVEINIAYEEDLGRVMEVLEDVCREVRSKRDDIVEGPTVLGVTKLGSSEVVVTILARTVPMQQWSVEREIRKAVKDRFVKENIEIPYPRVVYLKRVTERGDEGS
ncbi:MAG: mechanosensitive ion channel family protein [Tepidanaerobacteraceae bacterium]|jgi:small conductance mechanosensitive channel|nr:mechanosensitive ion channel family protein [Tepidanaerobacteraceae bacterium]